MDAHSPQNAGAVNRQTGFFQVLYIIFYRFTGDFFRAWACLALPLKFPYCFRDFEMFRSPRLLIAGRALAGLSREELARKAGIAVSVLQDIEIGKSDPKSSTVLALIDALKAHGVELLPPATGVSWGVFVVPGSDAEKRGRTPTPEERKSMAAPRKAIARAKPVGRST